MGIESANTLRDSDERIVNEQSLTCACGQSFTPPTVQFEKRTYRIRTECPACYERRQTALAQEREEQAEMLRQREKVKHERAWETICPPLYRQFRHEEFPESQRENLAKILSWQYGPRGLIVHGDTDLGKTRAMFLLLRRLHDERRKIIAFNCVSFGHKCGVLFGRTNGDGEKWIGEVSTADVVFFDDIEKTRFTDRVESELFGVIETRIANLLPVFITTNFVGQDFKKVMTENRALPFIRRIKQFCTEIIFTSHNQENP